MSKNDNSIQRIESGLKRGLKAQLLQRTRSGQMDGDAINLFLPNLGQRKTQRPESIDDYCFSNATELASCRGQLVEYLENWQPEGMATEKTQTNPKANFSSYNRAVDLWAKKHGRLDKTFPPLEKAGILKRTEFGYNLSRRQYLLLWLLITVENGFSRLARCCPIFYHRREKKDPRPIARGSTGKEPTNRYSSHSKSCTDNNSQTTVRKAAR